MESVRSLTQAYSQAPWRKQLKFIVLFLLIVVFTALIAGIYLDVTARTATIGREIQLMQSRIEDLKLVNSDLETRLAVLLSANQMEDRARRMGFEPITRDQMVFLVVDGYVPRLQAVLAPAPAPVKTVAAALPSNFTESLLDWVQAEVVPQVRQMLQEVRP
jgi:cell division protein FtsL